MRKRVQHLLIGTLFLLAASVFAQTTSGGANPNPNPSSSDFKSGVTSSAQKVSDALMQDLQQQLVIYRAQHPVGAAPDATNPSPSLLTPLPAVTPPANTTPPPPTSITNKPAASSTYTGFGTSQPANQNPSYKPYQPATKPTTQWNVRY